MDDVIEKLKGAEYFAVFGWTNVHQQTFDQLKLHVFNDVKGHN